MTTFSQLVDEVLDETKRFDMRAQFAVYLNQTIREIHFEPERGNAVFFHDNYRESLLTADADEGFSWPIPDSAVFQGGMTARYDRQIDNNGYPRYAIQLTPGPRVERESYVFQRAGNSVVFKGYGGVGAPISFSWYEYPKSLKYYAPADRPASYDSEDGWTYAAGVVSEEDQLAAQARVTNWILLRWNSVLIEGLRAKVYKRLADETRARTSYSLYSQLRNGLFTSEISQFNGIN